MTYQKKVRIVIVIALLFGSLCVGIAYAATKLFGVDDSEAVSEATYKADILKAAISDCIESESVPPPESQYDLSQSGYNLDFLDEPPPNSGLPSYKKDDFRWDPPQVKGGRLESLTIYIRGGYLGIPDIIAVWDADEGWVLTKYRDGRPYN